MLMFKGTKVLKTGEGEKALNFHSSLFLCRLVCVFARACLSANQDFIRERNSDNQINDKYVITLIKTIMKDDTTHNRFS